jgi:MFS family permease
MRADAGVLAAVLPSRVLLRRPLLACFAITAVVHVATVLLNTLLPLHVTAMGGTKTQVGLLFSAATLVGMFLRPLVGGWVDRWGAARVIGPGAALMLLASVGLQFAATPGAVVGLMGAVGAAAALSSTPASVHAAQVSPAASRGEVLGVYYLFSSLPIAVAPALALGLFRSGGIALGFLTVTLMALATAACIPWLGPRAEAEEGAGRRSRLVSRHALGLAGVMIIATCGHSAIYGFVPLYALERGQGAALGWFFGVYAGWLIVCRALLRGLSDRVGRAPVVVPAMALLVAGYACLALPPGPPSLVAAALCLGSGGSLFYPTMVALVVDRTPPAERGLAIGTLSGAWDVGIVVGSAVVGFAVERAGFGAGFLVGAVCAAAGLALFLLGERRRRGGQASGP